MKTIGNFNSRKYTLNKIIGRGTYGIVYECLPYAIKEINLEKLSPKLRENVNTEMSILKECQHPNIVNLHDTIKEGKYVYLVMEYCLEDLDSYLKKHKLSQSQSISIFKQIVEGFRFLASRGVIHRDLKPANLLLNEKNEWKLADFGLAKTLSNFQYQMLNSTVGTPIYMPPQILENIVGIGNNTYTSKCDIWSLGVIFYEMLTQACPWYCETVEGLYMKMKKQKLMIPSNLSEWSKNLIIKMLEFNEKKRMGWDELFSCVLGKQKILVKIPRKNSSREFHHSKENIRKEELCDKQKGQRKRILSARKVEQGIKFEKGEEKQIIAIECEQKILMDILEIQLQFEFGDEKTKKILERNIKLTQEDNIVIEKILNYFNISCQKALRKLISF